MHLDQVQLTNILPVSFSLNVLEERLSSNFRIIVEALKTQEAIREKHDALASQNYLIKEELQQLKGKLSTTQAELEERVRKEVMDMQVQSSAIRIEFETMRPYLDKLKYNTERMDAVEKQFRLTSNVVKEFELIRKDILGMEGRSQLMIENYKDEYNRKTSRMQEEAQLREMHTAKLEETITGLKQRVEALNTSISLGIAKQLPAEPTSGKSAQSIDDVFKQKVLEKINDINSRLQEVAYQSETTSLRDTIKQLRKIIDNKMDMDQYERMLDFTGEELKRAILAHEQKEHSQTIRDTQTEIPSQPDTQRNEAEQPKSIEPNSQQPVLQTKFAEAKQTQPPLLNITADEPSLDQSGEESPVKKRNPAPKDQASPLKLSELKMDKIGVKDNNSIRRRHFNKTPSGSNNKTQVDEIKMLQTLNTRIQYLQGEVEDLRKTNINILHNMEQARQSEPSISRNEKTESLMGLKHTEKIYSGKKEMEPSLPVINRDGKYKVVTDDSIELIERHRRRNSNSNANMGSNPPRESSHKNAPSDDKSFVEKNKDLEKKLSDLRNEVHYYFKELEKSINVRETKEDVRKRIEEVNDRVQEIRKLIGKKIDAESAKKSMMFLQNKLNQVIAIMIANEGEAEATMARRGWACLSCDKGMDKFDGKQGEHKAWNLVQGHQSPPRGSGFASMQRSQQRYKNVYMDKSSGDE